MKRISDAPSDTTETRQSAQTGDEQDERKNPVTRVNPPASRQSAPDNVEGDRQVHQPPALSSLTHTEPGSPFPHDARSVQSFFLAPAQDTAPIGDKGPGRQGAGGGRQDGSRRNASPPMLRLREIAGFVHESADLPFSAPATDPTESAMAATSSASCMAGNTSHEYDLSALAAWVSSATPEYRAGHQAAEKRITAYRAAPEKQEWRLDFSRMWLLTLPPLPADVKSLCLRGTMLMALPESLPESLEEVDAGHTKLTALPENLPRNLKKLNVGSGNFMALPENLPAGLRYLGIDSTQLTALPTNFPPYLEILYVRCPKLSVLPTNFPPSLVALFVGCPIFRVFRTALPEGLQKFVLFDPNPIVWLTKLPEGLKVLQVYSEGTTALPPKLPEGLLILEVKSKSMTALPPNLPSGLEVLDIRVSNRLTVLENLPCNLRKLKVSADGLNALPEDLPPSLEHLDLYECISLERLPKNLPQSLRVLNLNMTGVTALPENLPQGLDELAVDATAMDGVLANLPPSLRILRATGLTTMPEGLPPGLQVLNVSSYKLSALPDDLPQGLKKLSVSFTELSELPANLPPGLQYLGVRDTRLSGTAMLDLLQARTSITEFHFTEKEVHPDLVRRIKEELAINKDHPARVAKAAATLDLLTRFGLMTSDETGMLIGRHPTPDPVPGQLTAQPIPGELHDVLAANCPKEVLAVLAGMVDGTAQ